MGLPKVWRGLNAGPYTPPPSWFAHSLASPELSLLHAGFIKPAARGQTRPPTPLFNFGVTFIGEMSTISSEGVTPQSSLLQAHVPLPLGSPLLQHLTSFEESLQVVRSPCCLRELPDTVLRWRRHGIAAIWKH